MIKLCYKDTITLIKTEIDGWNNESIAESKVVKALFVSNTGFSHSTNRDQIDSDAVVYLDINDPYIKENHNRLEEMLVIAQPYGDNYQQSWYRIINVEVGQDKLLKNKIDNILVSLKKSTEIHYVS